MKTLTGIVVLLVSLAGAFLFVTGGAHAAPKSCQGKVQVLWCEDKEPLHETLDQVEARLKRAGVPHECYKLRQWDNHQEKGQRGGLDKIQCSRKDEKEGRARMFFQPSGSHITQRAMFNSAQAKDAFMRETDRMEMDRKKAKKAEKK